eukprot:TRINITY_DN1547_c0_g3_i1.p2 TRINITY_DN1547_c0_g3~~TRINITY_DN1547_c0_g3_i1.p2  ORF type:complete len:245 (-),score=118.19 TRINITY_DN1547_c0_g3_i1:214-948(-)
MGSELFISNKEKYLRCSLLELHLKKQKKEGDKEKVTVREPEEEFIDPSTIEARREFWKKAAQDGSFIKNEKKRKEEEDKKKREERKKKEDEKKKREDEKKKEDRTSDSDKKQETIEEKEKEKEKEKEAGAPSPKSVNFNATTPERSLKQRLLVPRLRMSRVLVFAEPPSSPKGDKLAELFEKNGIEKKWAEVLVEQGVTDKESVAELLLEDLLEIGFPENVAQSLITLAVPWKSMKRTPEAIVD